MSLVEKASANKTEQDRKDALRQAAIAAKKRAKKARQARQAPTVRKRIFRTPEGSPFFVSTSGSRIPLSVDSEGNYFYYRRMDTEGNEFGTTPEGGGQKVIVVPVQTRRAE